MQVAPTQRTADLQVEPERARPPIHIPSSIRYFHCDLSSLESIASAAGQICSTLDNPTVLINNAGVVRGKTILESTEKNITATTAKRYTYLLSLSKVRASCTNP
jgi:NAD(P)-dependent dehydrogenase (short-subunit alcohol dehydrogenase family)